MTEFEIRDMTEDGTRETPRLKVNDAEANCHVGSPLAERLGFLPSTIVNICG